MHPDLFSLGPVTIHTYGLFLATGFFAGLLVATRLGRYQGIDPQKIMDMGFIMIIAGLIGSRLMYCIINISYFIENPIDIIKIWEGGLVFSGGLVALLQQWHGIPGDTIFHYGGWAIYGRRLPQ
jgi:phosphatidylglycerol:prolipoprotein diacylglycerol transferase